ncbi:MAG: hypothetical protein R3F37_23380 [Candidatus Competibacteraceae bacterium]
MEERGIPDLPRPDALHLRRHAGLVPFARRMDAGDGWRFSMVARSSHVGIAINWPIPANTKRLAIERRGGRIKPGAAGLGAGHPERPWLAKAQGNASATYERSSPMCLKNGRWYRWPG